MIDLISRHDLEDLSEGNNPAGSPCVSIYLPTHREPAAMQQDQTRFKNLINTCIEGTRDYGLRDFDGFFAETHRMMQSRDFLNTLADGLAVFIKDGETRAYRTPGGLGESATVSTRFHLKPLLPFYQHGRFYVVLLGSNRIHFYFCTGGTPGSIDEFPAPAIDTHITEGQFSEEYRKRLHFHRRVWTSGREIPAQFYQQGMGIEDLRNNMLPYLRQIGNVLRALLPDDRAPFVLAGIESLVTIFREANGHSFKLAEKDITDIPDDIAPSVLHARAMDIVRPHFDAELRKALGDYGTYSGTGMLATDLKEIVPAAFEGRILTLFVNTAKAHWGTFDPADYSIQVHDAKQPRDMDLIDFAATHTFLKDGGVFALDEANMPEKADVAAILRYGMFGSTPTNVSER